MVKERLSSETGFTFIELMIVVVLVGITAVLVLPRGLNDGINSTAVETEAVKIAGAIRLARQQAMQNADLNRISFNDGSSYSIYLSSSDPPSPPTETVNERVEIVPQLDEDKNYIEFDSLGKTEQTGEINLKEKTGHTTLKVLEIHAYGTVDIKNP